ncbi:RNA polymerase sigma factor [Paraneptunicella aestuarii]|uniref:RNA polymerase sigma factor n=1 Tax=Paraneptunicella aestuarii TaxID=2831148 RepID=UPI001E3BCFD6|nr:RNA polymerase sigma factor [Paraneptunicella aestuarii]UAA37990.1 RNA polymerase sigma factor [Paraneptunicella aestuarii]
MSKRSELVDVFLNYRTQLRRAVSGIVRSDDIDDIVQETFIKSYEADLKQDIKYERTYMLRTARNLALNHVSRACERSNVSMEECGEFDTNLMGAHLETLFESKERFFHFCRATDMLSNEVKRVFILKKVYGLSQKEIADHLGISESMVEKHVAKGLQKCSNILERLNLLTTKNKSDTVKPSRLAIPSNLLELSKS